MYTIFPIENANVGVPGLSKSCPTHSDEEREAARDSQRLAGDDAHDVDLEQAPDPLGPELRGGFVERGRVQAGVVDQDVDATVLADDVAEHRAHTRFVGHAAGDPGGAE